MADIRLNSGQAGYLGGGGPNSDIAKSGIYDGQGNPINPAELARGSAFILIKQTTAAAVATVVWCMRNTSATRTIVIPRIVVQFAMEGTGAATSMRYEFVKYTGCTATTGNAVTPSIWKTSLTQAGGVEAKALDTGITLTNGVLQGGTIWVGTWGRITQSATAQASSGWVEVIDQPPTGMGPIELVQNEVVAIRVGPTNAAVIGDIVMGKVSFYEK